MKESLQSELAPRPIGPYSQACKVAGFVFVSGQGSFDPSTGALCGNTIEEQTRQTLSNIGAILCSARATMKDVVKVTVVLSDLSYFSRMNDVYKEFFDHPYPARICYGGQLAIAGMLVEIDVIAHTAKWTWE